ncbi:ATP-dependent DNA/RNA helicase DHX36-like isoform X2 [Aricia agestis]|uniref:ATP-dependent DNA/RNA helicase DHX36-like isoform X2 n=1 Tax=Aricia agestis TaxID=91739 RepID=UPI001C208AA8|nr:ATP-dependent DNA/RNA helicase DHX36-like isoform X2 [Aricia agestis]
MSREHWKKPRSRVNRQNNSQRSRIPPGLKGKEIGLYFRDRGRERKNKEKIINFVIPKHVLIDLEDNLITISEIAKLEKISLKHIVDVDIFEGSKHGIKLEKMQIKNEITNDPMKEEPGTSKTEASPIKTFKANDGSKVNSEHLNNYKYGYEDIITGTFSEKLEECLQKGASINKSTEETELINVDLYEELEAIKQNKTYKEMLKFREMLPAYKKAKEIVDIVEKNQVIVISGETGCGKSTQVPQVILDVAISNYRGAHVKIMVTQPRRIAASALAIRVGKERGNSLKKSVGYAVRLERVEERPRGSIVYCTTGILLALLEVNQGLTDYSHIILDEVHERDSHVDLSMLMLKQVLKKRKDLKLILMSATLDAGSLSAYFDDAPVMHIEGLAYPVQDIFLEDILKVTKYSPREDRPRGPQPKWMKYRKKGNVHEMEKDIKYRAEISHWLESQKKNLDFDVYKTLQNSRIEDLDLDLILQLLIHICKGKPGAILVFLPGIGEITKLMRLMDESRCFPSQYYEIYPLHSKLATLDQHRIFERPPESVRKIIIATNIAETSITIDDIVYVVDCAKIKINGLNVEQNISTLEVQWVSKANLHQRRGRAGRCQPGICYHLLTSYRAENLQERLAPELQRSNLLEAVLTIKRLRLGQAAEALSKVQASPAVKTIEWAVSHLQKCGALDETETLTPLGWHLARLPVHPSAGKLVLFGALFGCLDRAASVAAVWGFKDPFNLVIGKEAQADACKRNFNLGEPSDHIAVSEAIIQWEQCPTRHKRSFAYDNFLSNNTLELLSDMKKQLGDNLKQMGFLNTGDVKSPWENRNSDNLSLFKAIVAAALYPNIATVRWLGRNPTKQKRIIAHSPEDGRLALHPSSVMSAPKSKAIVKLCDNPGANWLVYWLKQRTAELYVFDVTLIYTLPLLFFGELKINLAEDPNYCLLSISSIKVRCLKDTAIKVYQCRSLLDQVLASKIAGNLTTQNNFEDRVLQTVIRLITAEDEQVDYYDDDISELEYDEKSE